MTLSPLHSASRILSIHFLPLPKFRSQNQKHSILQRILTSGNLLYYLTAPDRSITPFFCLLSVKPSPRFSNAIPSIKPWGPGLPEIYPSTLSPSSWLSGPLQGHSSDIPQPHSGREPQASRAGWASLAKLGVGGIPKSCCHGLLCTL